jgi:hypothetical protein
MILFSKITCPKKILELQKSLLAEKLILISFADFINTCNKNKNSCLNTICFSDIYVYTKLRYTTRFLDPIINKKQANLIKISSLLSAFRSTFTTKLQFFGKKTNPLANIQPKFKVLL